MVSPSDKLKWPRTIELCELLTQRTFGMQVFFSSLEYVLLEKIIQTTCYTGYMQWSLALAPN